MAKIKNTCLIKYQTQADLTKIDRKELIEQFRKILNGKVEQAYLFGSFADGKVTNSSDIDLILIKKTKKKFLNRGEEFFHLYDIHPNLDLLIYTPDEFQQLLTEDIGFWSSVKASMQPLF